jgi:hypothetical protein
MSKNGKKWKPPANQIVKIALPDGKTAQAVILFGMGSVDTRVRAFGRWCRDTTGCLVTVPFSVPEVRIELSISPGQKTTCVSRACCKPPDVFDEKTGIRYATKRLVRNAKLPREYHEPIVRALCPYLFEPRKKRGQKQTKDQAPSPQA